MSKKLYIGNIPTSITVQILFDLFSKFGQVKTVNIPDGIGPDRHAGYAYVTMESEKGAEDVVKKLHQSLLQGSRILVTEAHQLDQDRRNFYYRRY